MECSEGTSNGFLTQICARKQAPVSQPLGKMQLLTEIMDTAALTLVVLCYCLRNQRFIHSIRNKQPRQEHAALIQAVHSGRLEAHFEEE